MWRGIVAVFVLAGLGLIGVGARPASAQAGQPLNLPCVKGVAVEPLAQAMPASADGQALVVLRLTVASGGRFSPHTHPGTVTAYVDSGALDFTHLGDHPMDVMRAASGATPATAEPLTKGVTTTLHPGDWIVETGMVHTAFNTGGAPTVVLVSGPVPPDQPLVQCVAGTPTP